MEKSNSDIAKFLRRTADLLELRGENPFKVRSYRTASATIDDLGTPAVDMARDGGVATLQQLPGVGKSIAAHIQDFLETGTSPAFERLRVEAPESAADLLVVRGIGMKMATTLYRDFGILDLEDLSRFAEGGGFEAVPGLGDKSIARLVGAVAAAVAAEARVPLAEAGRLAGELAGRLETACEGAEVIVAGEVRRGLPKVSRIDLLAVTGDPAAATAAFAALPEAGEAVVLTAERAETATALGICAGLATAAPANRAVALVRATGSRRHVRQLDERAEALGIALGDGPPASEQDVYDRLGVPFVPPERREGLDEVAG